MAIGAILANAGKAILGSVLPNLLSGGSESSGNEQNNIEVQDTAQIDTNEVLNSEGTKLKEQQEVPTEERSAEPEELINPQLSEFLSEHNYVPEDKNIEQEWSSFSSESKPINEAPSTPTVTPTEETSTPIEVDMDNGNNYYETPQTYTEPVDNEPNAYAAQDTDIHLSTMNGPNTSGVINDVPQITKPFGENLEQQNNNYVERQDSYLTKDEIKDVIGTEPTDEQVEKVNDNFHEENGNIVLDNNATSEGINSIADNNSNISDENVSSIKESLTKEDDKELLKQAFLEKDAFLTEDELHNKAKELGIENYKVNSEIVDGEQIFFATPFDNSNSPVLLDDDFNEYIKNKLNEEEFTKLHSSDDEYGDIYTPSYNLSDKQVDNRTEALLSAYHAGEWNASEPDNNSYENIELLIEYHQRHQNAKIPSVAYYDIVWNDGLNVNRYAKKHYPEFLEGMALEIKDALRKRPDLVPVWNNWLEEENNSINDDGTFESKYAEELLGVIDRNILENIGELQHFTDKNGENSLKVHTVKRMYVFNTRNVSNKTKEGIKKESQSNPIELSTENIDSIDSGVPLKEGNYVVADETTLEDINNGEVTLENVETGEKVKTIFDDAIDRDELKDEVKQIENVSSDISSDDISNEANDETESATKKAKKEQTKSKLKNWFKRFYHVSGSHVDTNVPAGGSNGSFNVESSGTKLSKSAEPNRAGATGSSEHLTSGNSKLNLSSAKEASSNEKQTKAETTATNNSIKGGGKNSIDIKEPNSFEKSFHLPKTNSAVQTVKKQLKKDENKTNRHLNKDTSMKLKGTKYGGNSKQMFTASVHSNSSLISLVDKLSETIIKHYHQWNRSGVYFYFNGDVGKVRYKVGGTVEIRWKGENNWASLKTISTRGNCQQNIEKLINEINRS